MNTASNSLVIDFEHTTVEKVDHLLTHITNVRQDFKDDGQELSIEVVAYGAAIQLFTQDGAEFRDRIAELQGLGVIFGVCRTAMNALEVDDSQLLNAVEVVPSGVGHLVKLQLTGSAYIKA